MPLSGVQVFKGSAGFVDATMLKNAPGVLVKANWNAPSLSV